MITDPGLPDLRIFGAYRIGLRLRRKRQVKLPPQIDKIAKERRTGKRRKAQDTTQGPDTHPCSKRTRIFADIS
jgi:hypothetical protein